MGFVLFSLVWLVFLPSFLGVGYGRREFLLFVLGFRIGSGCGFCGAADPLFQQEARGKDGTAGGRGLRRGGGGGGGCRWHEKTMDTTSYAYSISTSWGAPPRSSLLLLLLARD